MKSRFYSALLFSVFLILIIPMSVGMIFHNGRPSRKQIYKKTAETKISFLNCTDNKIKECGVEDYLVGVLAAEMPAEYEVEALKAQAVAARSFIIRKTHNISKDHPDADVCTDATHCKGYMTEKMAKKKWNKEKADTYWQKLTDAVWSTQGEYMVCGEEVVEAFFFARSGGMTENSEDVWSEERPYLKSVSSEEDKSHPQYEEVKEFLNMEARQILQKNGFDTRIGSQKIEAKIISKTKGGNVAEACFDGQSLKGTEVRLIFGLKSADFDILAEEDKIKFVVRGYGHGVGMSQYGANQMAKNGKKYTEILSHYYTNIQIIRD